MNSLANIGGQPFADAGVVKSDFSKVKEISLAVCFTVGLLGALIAAICIARYSQTGTFGRLLGRVNPIPVMFAGLAVGMTLLIIGFVGSFYYSDFGNHRLLNAQNINNAGV